MSSNSSLRTKLAQSAGACLVRLACMCSLVVVGRNGRAASHFETIATLSGEGSHPLAELIEGHDGTLYGVACSGGVSDDGTVFKLSRDGGTISVLHVFGTIPSDGSLPSAPLFEGDNGMLYGSTFSSEDPIGAGVIFSLSEKGNDYQVLHRFNDSDGGQPLALVFGPGQTLYGVTMLGGSNGVGTVFSLSVNGSAFKVLHNFPAYRGDAVVPDGLVQDTNATLYGTSSDGGANGYGTVFTISSDGTSYRVLYSFVGGTNDGQFPMEGLLLAGDGVLYGTTLEGGAQNAGTVFKLARNGGNYERLHVFDPSVGDGAFPNGHLIEGPDGALYGTTRNGGGLPYYVSDGSGTVFKISKDGARYEVVYAFARPYNGIIPSSGLVLAKDSLFYGTTAQGGPGGVGTFFRLTPPETPDLISMAVQGTKVLLTLAGKGGENYEVLRSSDLREWSLVSSFVMPLEGVFTNLDTSPFTESGYYRARWLP